MERLKLRLFVSCSALSALFVLGCVAGSGPATEAADNPYSTVAVDQPDRGSAIARSALDLLGTSYQYGGTSPEEGFDCSGLVQFVHARFGIEVPRTSTGQFRAGADVGTPTAGDVLYFRIGGRISHAGVYIGDGRFVHAPKTGRQVSIAPLDLAYYRDRYAGARRFH